MNTTATDILAICSVLSKRLSFRRLILAVFFYMILAAGTMATATAAEVGIESLSQNGVLTWTNASLSVTCRVEWASSAGGPWQSNWSSLTNIVITNQTTTKAVPMFYRVVCTPPPPWLSNVTASVALSLVQARSADPTFTILDVRTPSEFAPQHMKKAVNIDYNSGYFSANVSQLDKNQCYLLYCGSGNRSRQASVIMQGLGFAQIYNMSVGLSSFAALPGASAFLEP